MATVVVSKIKSTGGDYTSLNAWYKAKKGDLVSRDTIEVAELYSSTDGGFCKFTTGDCTVDSSHYFQIRAADPSGISHNRGWGFYKAIWDNTHLPPRCTLASGVPVIDCGVPYTLIGPGVSIFNRLNSGGSGCYAVALRDGPTGVNECVIDSCALYGTTHGLLVANWASGSSPGHCVKNSLISSYLFCGNQLFCTNRSFITAFNNYFISGNWCVSMNVTKNAKVYSENNYLGCPAGAVYSTGTGGQIRKGLKDASNTTEVVDATLRSIAKTSVVISDMTDPTYGSYRMIGSGCALRGKGVDLRSNATASFRVVYDFEGDVRPPTLPDIGWDQYTPAREIISSVKPSGGGDFQTLTGWSNARQSYVYMKNVTEIAEIYGGSTSGCSMSKGSNGWSTINYAFITGHAADCQIKIRAATGWEQTAILPQTNKAYVISTPNTSAFTMPVGNMIIGPGIHFNCPVGGFQTGEGGTGNRDNILYRCVIKPLVPLQGGAVSLTQSSANLYVRDCYIDCPSTYTYPALYVNEGRGAGVLGSLIDARNCTIVHRRSNAYAVGYAGGAVSTWPDIRLQNCYLYGAGDGYSRQTATYIRDSFTATSDSKAETLSLRKLSLDNYTFIDSSTGVLNLRPRPESVLATGGTPIAYKYKCDSKDIFGNLWPVAGAIGCVAPKTATIINKDIKPAGGGDYTTIAAWEAARRGNLVASGSCFLEQATCYSGGNLGVLTMASGTWTVGPENYAKIITATGHAHSGVFDTTNKAYAEVTAAANLWDIQIGFTYICGLQLHSKTGGQTALLINNIHGQQPVDIDRVFIKRSSNSSVLTRLEANFDITCGHIIRNSIILLGDGAEGFCVYCGSTRKNLVRIYSCDIINLCTGNSATLMAYSTNSNIVEENNYLYALSTFSPGSDVYRVAAGGAITKGTRTASNKPETSTAALGRILFTTANFKNVTAGTEDFHLVRGSQLIMKGKEMAYCPQDIDWTTRPTVYMWSIGADDGGLIASNFWQHSNLW